MTIKLGYRPANSWFHKRDPLVNIVILFCGSFLMFYFQDPMKLSILFVGVLFLFVFSKLNPYEYFRKIKTIVYFALTITIIQWLFTSEGEHLFYLIPEEMPYIGKSLSVTDIGMARGLQLSLRFLGIISLSAFFVFVTEPTQLAQAITRIGVSYRYAYTLVLALRFVPLFDLEQSHVRNARLARGIDLEKRGVRGIFALIRYTFIPLIISALSRVDSLAISMEGRAFGLHKKRTFMEPRKRSLKEISISIIVIVTTSTIVLLDLFSDNI
ncbi:MAG: energy-coupling factor transporter transmembrane component T family protein [Candidatus Kariarchaeaceae archaeon]